MVLTLGSHARRETTMPLMLIAVAIGVCFAGAIAAITFGLR
jgi:hypothetical protein